jgi:hypothetical protein
MRLSAMVRTKVPNDRITELPLATSRDVCARFPRCKSVRCSGTHRTRLLWNLQPFATVDPFHAILARPLAGSYQ